MSDITKIEWTDQANWVREKLRPDGYVLVLCPKWPGPRSGGKNYVLKHRIVMSAKLGRVLTADEHVHHINGNKQDNRLENLEILSNSNHRRHHERAASPEWKRARAIKASAAAIIKTKKPRLTIECQCSCGQQIENLDSKGRPRLFVHGHNNQGKTWKWRVS